MFYILQAMCHGTGHRAQGTGKIRLNGERYAVCSAKMKSINRKARKVLRKGRKSITTQRRTVRGMRHVIRKRENGRFDSIVQTREDLFIAEPLLPCCYRRLLHHRFEYRGGLSLPEYPSFRN